VANRNVLRILPLLMAISASLVGVPADAHSNAQISWHLNVPCNDEWQQTAKSSADPQAANDPHIRKR